MIYTRFLWLFYILSFSMISTAQNFNVEDFIIQSIDSTSDNIVSMISDKTINIHITNITQPNVITIDFNQELNYPTIVLSNITIAGKRLPSEIAIKFNFTGNNSDTKLLPLYVLDSTVVDSNTMTMYGAFEGRTIISSEVSASQLKIKVFPLNGDTAEIISLSFNEILVHDVPLSELLQSNDYSDLRSKDCEKGINTFVVIDDSESMTEEDEKKLTDFIEEQVLPLLNIYNSKTSNLYFIYSQEVREYTTKGEEMKVGYREVLSELKNKEGGTDFIKDIKSVYPYLNPDKFNLVFVFHDGWPNSLNHSSAKVAEITNELNLIREHFRKANGNFIYFVPLGDPASPYMQFWGQESIVKIKHSLYNFRNKCIGEDDTKLTFSIYPNPNIGDFTITIDGIDVKDTEVRVSIINSRGRIIKKNVLQASNQRMIVQDIAPGLYYVQLQTEKDLLQKKVIILN